MGRKYQELTRKHDRPPTSKVEVDGFHLLEFDISDNAEHNPENTEGHSVTRFAKVHGCRVVPKMKGSQLVAH
jgi:hypothetical protein